MAIAPPPRQALGPAEHVCLPSAPAGWCWAPLPRGENEFLRPLCVLMPCASIWNNSLIPAVGLLVKMADLIIPAVLRHSTLLRLDHTL